MTLSVPFVRPNSDVRIRRHVVVFSIGGIAAWVEIVAPFAALLAAVEDLAASQATCLEARACPLPVPVPAVMLADPIAADLSWRPRPAALGHDPVQFARCAT